MITEGCLARHYQGRKGGRGPALIGIAGALGVDYEVVTKAGDVH